MIRAIRFFAFGLVAFVFALSLVGYFLIPAPKGFHAFSHLKEPTLVEWDKAGVPVIRSADLQDAYFVQGFITARDRFFQMDIARRKMAGKLAEIFGRQALESDLASRKWGYHQAAKSSFAQMDAKKREPLISYAKGVNAFLTSQSRPWEFWFLGLNPAPWQPEDSFLIVLSMYDSLNRHKESDEKVVSILRAKLSPSITAFLTPDWGFLDEPIVKDPSPLFVFPAPNPKEFRVTETHASQRVFLEDFEPGSNAWVVSGKLTQSGKPLLAGDPHLDLRVPNLWYRVGLKTPSNFVYGASIPGIPGIVIGRNDHVAWSFTNSAIDNCDQVILPKQLKTLHIRREEILIKNGGSHQISFTDSPWGPIIEENDDHLVAAQWAALDPSNLKQLDLTSINEAKNTTELLEALGHWGGPPQNVVFAAQDGNIGWSIVGNLPKRIGFDGKSRVARTASTRWDGYVPRKNFPIVLNPPEGFIVNANQRTLPPHPSLAQFGYHWPNAARAKRITDLVRSTKLFQASSFQTIQTDNRSLTHLKYREELLKCSWEGLSEEDKSWISPAIQIIKDWDGTTSIGSTGYPILKAFRVELFRQLISPIAKTISLSNSEIISNYLGQDTFVYQLLLQQPKNFLSPAYRSYCDVMKSSLKEAIRSLASTPEQLALIRWGNFNRSDIRHPFARTLPKFLSPLFSMPTTPMGGDSLVPNVMTPRNGASMRMIIDFAEPKQSLFSQPGGQSGHPLSSHFSDLFDSWISGRGVSFELSQIKHLEKFIPKPNQ